MRFVKGAPLVAVIVISLGICVSAQSGGKIADMVRAEDAAEAAQTPADRFYQSTQLARRALTDGDLVRAAGIADHLVAESSKFKDDWNYGNALHLAELVYGHKALAADDLDAARKHLLAAGRTPGSPQLRSFGPDMALAAKLLARGERGIVLEYFELCGNFWTNGTDKLARWTAEVKAGGTPDFGPNMRYFN